MKLESLYGIPQPAWRATPCPEDHSSILLRHWATFTLHITAPTGRRSFESPRSPQSQARSPRDPEAPDLTCALQATVLVFAAEGESQEIHFSAQGTLLWTQGLLFRDFLQRRLSWKTCPLRGSRLTKVSHSDLFTSNPNRSSGLEGEKPARPWCPGVEALNSLGHQQSKFLGNALPNFHH